MNEDLYNSYVDSIKNILNGHPFTYLLSSSVYSVPKGEAVNCPSGRPFSLDLDEIQKFFGSDLESF